MQKVLIIYRTIPQYRVEFYNSLREKLKEQNIELELIYGNSHVDNRKDTVRSDWAIFKDNVTINLGVFKLIWQPCWKEVKSADFVIVEQANKLLINYLLILRKLIKHKKFAFWGHGLNLQAPKKSFFNNFKRTYTNLTDWWFAYTDGIKKFLIENGFNENRITVVQNAIDTKLLSKYYNSIQDSEVSTLKEQLGITGTETIFIYCGALYKEKMVDFMIDALDRLKDKGLDFKFLIIGSGPLDDFVAKAAAERPWIINIGPKFGRDKALYFKVSDIFLHPGAMGLAILDSFAFETPMITAPYEFHGPEFEYVVDDYNGIISTHNIDDFIADIEELVNDKEKYNQLKSVFGLMVEKYNNETMVQNFADGILKALN